MSKNAVILLLIFIIGLAFAEPFTTKGLTPTSPETALDNQSEFNNVIILGDSLLANNFSYLVKKSKEQSFRGQLKVIKTIITAYTSTPEETDNTPFITASGSYVRYGVAAANFLPIGARIRIPKVFGEQVFVIEDRLHNRFNDRIDIWFSEKELAKEFGLKISEVEIL